MESQAVSPRHHRLLTCLSCLPQRILSVHGLHNVTEFVLHDLCIEPCFNLEKAAYLVDNPDFNCLKGIAGFAQKERFDDYENIWDKQDQFASHMQSAPFNQKVRGVGKPSIRAVGTPDQEALQALAADLDITNPSYFTWDMKHGNRGILLFQRAEGDTEPIEDPLLRGLYLLGFCPVF